jgi:hypothetical protein
VSFELVNNVPHITDQSMYTTLTDRRTLMNALKKRWNIQEFVCLLYSYFNACKVD